MAINPPKKPQAVPSYPRQVQAAAQRLDARVKAASVTDGVLDTRTAKQPDFDAVRTRAAQQRMGTNTPKPATATPQGVPLAPSRLTPEEAASFQRQNPNFSQANPTAPTVGNTRMASNGTRLASTDVGGPVDDGLRAARERVRANPGVPAGAQPPVTQGLAQPNTVPAAQRVPVMQRVGGVVQQVGDAMKAGAQRVGLQRVQPLGNKLLDGARGTGVAALAAGAIGGANTARETSTDVYANRLGLDPSVQRGVLAETGIRTAGTLQDVGNSLLDGLNSVGTFVTGGLYNPGSYAEATRAADQGIAPSAAKPGPAPAAPAAQPGQPDFSNVQGGTSSYGVAERTKANDGITPVGDRTGNAGEVLGTFNGKPITRGQSDALAGNQSFGGPTTIAEGLDDYRAPRGGGGFAMANPGGGSEERAKDLLDPTSAAGKLYQQLAADKTPTGKRVAAQFAETYLNGGTAERGQDVDSANSATSANASIQRGREGDAAQIEQQRIAGKKGPQYQTSEDGSIMSIADGIATPVTTKDGKPVKGAGKAREAGLTVDQMLGRIQEMVGDRADYGDQAEYDAARAQARATLMAELGGESKNTDQKDQ